jgi:hypothetical protein
MKEFMNLFLFIGISFVVYILFRNFNYGYKEGMTTTDASGNSVITTQNGIATNAASYSATIKSSNMKINDELLISKYKSDYENVILNMDDMLNNLMLQTTLSVDTTNPQSSIKQLAEMNQAKAALNNVMKYLDKQ